LVGVEARRASVELEGGAGEAIRIVLASEDGTSEKGERTEGKSSASHGE
jgi:hypothetical protein